MSQMYGSVSLGMDKIDLRDNMIIGVTLGPCHMTLII